MTKLTRIPLTLIFLAASLSQQAWPADPKVMPTYTYNPIELGEPDGEYLGYQYVDLGLESGNLWAIHNIGADVPEGTGLYFAWGEVEPKEYYKLSNYDFFLGYDFDSIKGRYCVYENIGDEIAGTIYDAATYHWGEGWRTPTFDDFYEIWVYCEERYGVSLNDVTGSRLTGSNGHEIFFPCNGWGPSYVGGPTYVNISGGYWSSTDTPYPYPYLPVHQKAYTLEIDSWNNMRGGYSTSAKKYMGAGIRPVTNKSVTALTSPTDNRPAISFSYSEGRVDLFGPDEEYLMTVSDLSGRKIYATGVSPGSHQLPPLTKGIYLITFYKGNSVVVTKKIGVK